MKKQIPILDVEVVKRSFPIHDKLDGWYFSMREQSPCVWLIEGTDLYGRMVSRTGTDEDKLLAQCIEDAKKITSSLK